MTGPTERFEEPSRSRIVRAVLPVRVREDLAVELPEVVRWALSLNEGSLLASKLEKEPVRVSFNVYERRVRLAAEAVDPPWPYVEELLALPMGRLVGGGGLELPEEAAEVLDPRPGSPLLLWAGAPFYEGRFALEPYGEGRAPELLAIATYPMRVEDGNRVLPPADALRFLPNPPEDLRIPRWLRGCEEVQLNVTVTERKTELSWTCYRRD